MMLDYIDRHVEDPELGADALALKFHCSQRYVHKLFSTTGRSVGEHVNGLRILCLYPEFAGSRSSTRNRCRNRI